MEKKELIYTGKAKKLYATDIENVLWIEYLDQATALNGVKKDHINGKGKMNNQIMSVIFQWLGNKGHETHFIRQLSEHEQLVKSVDIIPLEVVLRNVTAGSFAKRFQFEEGQELKQPIIEFYYKSDELNDPFINEDHIQFLNIASKAEVEQLKTLTKAINESLKEFFQGIDIILVDFKLEFGRNSEGKIILADEISPDTCRLWDVKTKAHLDKDVYRRDLGDLLTVYQEVFRRIQEKY